MSNNSENSRFYPCFLFVEHVISKLIGLSPWAMDTSKIFRKNRLANREVTITYKLSVIGSCYNILLTVFYLLFDVLSVFNHLKAASMQVMTPMTMKLAFVLILCMSAITLIYAIRQNMLISVKNQFNCVDEKLNSCADYELDQNNTHFWIYITNTGIIYSLIMLRLVFPSSWVQTIALMLPIVFGSNLIIQYAKLVNMIQKRLESINVTLLKLESSSHRAISNDISSIKYAYIELCDMSDNITDFYGIPTVMIIILFSVRNINNCYRLILILLNEAEMKSSVFSTVIFVVQTCFLLTMLTTSVTQVKKQNAKTTRIINKLLDQFAINKEITEKLSMFSNDLWFMKVDFTLCDIVPLDRTFLAVVSGTIITYLIIVVQFHLSKVA